MYFCGCKDIKDMVSFNIFELIGEFFNLLFTPFKWIRLTVAKEYDGWWTSNIVNFFFVFVLICLLTWWVSQAIKFKKQGKEDCA